MSYFHSWPYRFLHVDSRSSTRGGLVDRSELLFGNRRLAVHHHQAEPTSRISRVVVPPQVNRFTHLQTIWSTHWCPCHSWGSLRYTRSRSSHRPHCGYVMVFRPQNTTRSLEVCPTTQRDPTGAMTAGRKTLTPSSALHSYAAHHLAK